METGTSSTSHRDVHGLHLSRQNTHQNAAASIAVELNCHARQRIDMALGQCCYNMDGDECMFLQSSKEDFRMGNRGVSLHCLCSLS